MYRLIVLAGLLGLVAVVSGAAQADDKDSKAKDIGEVMKKAHTADEAFRKVIAKAVKDKDYESAATTAKAWVALSSQLGKFDPPKGEKASWKKLTTKYAKDVKSLAGAIDKKNARGAGQALATINKSCGTCHKAHKGS